MDELNGVLPEQFLEALKRRNLEGKRALIADLRRRKTDRAVEILVDILEEDSWYLRELAVAALAEVIDDAAPRLTKLLDSGLWYTRAAAARALGKGGHAASLPRLVALLDEDNKTVQGAALASVADLVREGHASETAQLIWARGARRAEELKRLLLAVHPDAGGPVAELLADPSALLKEVPAPEDASDEDTARRNA
jgi:HEAT repeat protein